jgi:hypothetical protein
MENLEAVTHPPENDGDLCVICHAEFAPVTEPLMKITDCAHIYHKDCIEKWFEYDESCPLCRKSLAAKHTPTLLQYILLFLSLSPPTSPRDNSSLHTYTSMSLSATAFTCCFLYIILDSYKTPPEYNRIKQQLINLKGHFTIDNERLSDNINLSSRTAAARELNHRQVLLRSQLLQWLWTNSDPHDIDDPLGIFNSDSMHHRSYLTSVVDPPQLPHGKKIFQHFYLQEWIQKIQPHLNQILSTL